MDFSYVSIFVAVESIYAVSVGVVSTKIIAWLRVTV